MDYNNYQMSNVQLAGLVQPGSPEAALKEVKTILAIIAPTLDVRSIVMASELVIQVYRGKYPGYRACNTGYHDLSHTIDVFLAMARLIHGAAVDGEQFNQRQIVLGLLSSLFHDVGYVQEENDQEGTGAKHASIHVQRSMDFFEEFARDHGLSNDEIISGQTIIRCTDLTVDLTAIDYPSPEVKLLGKILGSADLLAQMADRYYLEKLLFLYREFKEENVNQFDSDIDLLRKTLGFYDYIDHRLAFTLDQTERFERSHFSARWGVDASLYREAIHSQKNYLSLVLKLPNSDPRHYLKRGGIVKRVLQEYGNNN